jgi:hypothetical protein
MIGSVGVTFAASGEAVVDPFVFVDQWGTIIDPMVLGTMDSNIVDSFTFNNQGWVVVVPFYALDRSLISLTRTNYVRFQDLMTMRYNVETFDAKIADVWVMSWTAAASGGTLTVTHLNEIRDAFVTIQSTPESLELSASGLFYDRDGNVIAPPDFTENSIFNVGIYENEYAKLVRANNRLSTDMLVGNFSFIWGIKVVPLDFVSQGWVIVSPFTFSSSGWAIVDPFIYTDTWGYIVTPQTFSMMNGWVLSGSVYYVTLGDCTDSTTPTCDGTTDTTVKAWNNGSVNYTTTSQTSLYSGSVNTANLITIDSDSVTGGTQLHDAAQYCADMNYAGYTDWFLPAKNELNMLYTGRVKIGGFATGDYVSSTEASSSNVWIQSFATGSQTSVTKNPAYYVRCIRKA